MSPQGQAIALRVAIYVAISGLFAVPAWGLWNWVFSGSFGWPRLGGLEAWGLMFSLALLAEFVAAIKEVTEGIR